MRPAAAEPQAAPAVLMIRPAAFAGNPETAETNAFQSRRAPRADVAGPARAEFDAAAAALAEAGVRVHVVAGDAGGRCPDEIFPNNWVSFHADGSCVIYPLLAPSRRRERRWDLIDRLCRDHGYALRRTIDLTAHETHGCYLEGTGSLVLDRAHRIAYACRSPRTSDHALEDFTARLGYEAVRFEAVDARGRPVYHTNVVMSVGTGFAVICLEAIADAGERAAIVRRLAGSGREIIEITMPQMHAFAANLLELDGARGPVVALSSRAHAALGENQAARLAAHGRPAVCDIPTIETHGGGSLRCMLAEVPLPPAA